MTFSSQEPREEKYAPEDLGQADSPTTPEDLPPRFTVRLPQRWPYVAYTILGLTVLVYLVQMLTTQGLLDIGPSRCPYFFSPDLPACYGLKINEFILAGQYWRLISPILLHGSLLHVGFNMYALSVLGPELERHLGHWQFLALYLTSGFAGFVASFLLTASPSLGASTAIFGLLAAQGVFIYRNQHVFGPRAKLVLRSLINISLINFFIGLAPGIDNWGHFGGMLGGLLFTWIAAPEYRVAGEGPQYELENQKPESAALWATLITIVLFAILAAIPILRLALA